MSDLLWEELEPGIAVLRLNRPARFNALSRADGASQT